MEQYCGTSMETISRERERRAYMNNTCNIIIAARKNAYYGNATDYLGYIFLIYGEWLDLWWTPVSYWRHGSTHSHVELIFPLNEFKHSIIFLCVALVRTYYNAFLYIIN